VQPGLVIAGRGQDDAVCHRQPQRMAELGCRQRQPAIEIHHQGALHGGNRLKGLSLTMLSQDPLEHFKDGDRRHHEGTFVSHQGQKGLSLPAVGEHLDPTRGIDYNAFGAHKRSASR